VPPKRKITERSDEEDRGELTRRRKHRIGRDREVGRERWGEDKSWCETRI